MKQHLGSKPAHLASLTKLFMLRVCAFPRAAFTLDSLSRLELRTAQVPRAPDEGEVYALHRHRNNNADAVAALFL